MLNKKIDAATLDLKDTLVTIKRVTKTVKGGRNMRFTALMVVGDEQGHVGVGLGKAKEIPEAIRKGKEDAMKHLIYIERNEEDSLYHEIHASFGGAKILLKPAPQGTGIIAGGPARAVMELAGIKNVRAKSLGSNNKQNVCNAVIEGLKTATTPEKVAALRGKTVEEVLG
ncbi:MAG: 30S ribosomal protein S5 [Clostridiales bacterium]|nr:30S ribosomal protein S5 [Clostridiales bacterium]